LLLDGNLLSLGASGSEKTGTAGWCPRLRI
jgi:hypothetical protein